MTVSNNGVIKHDLLTILLWLRGDVFLLVALFNMQWNSILLIHLSGSVNNLNKFIVKAVKYHCGVHIKKNLGTHYSQYKRNCLCEQIWSDYTKFLMNLQHIHKCLVEHLNLFQPQHPLWLFFYLIQNTKVTYNLHCYQNKRQNLFISPS